MIPILITLAILIMALLALSGIVGKAEGWGNPEPEKPEEDKAPQKPQP